MHILRVSSTINQAQNDTNFKTSEAVNKVNSAVWRSLGKISEEEKIEVNEDEISTEIEIMTKDAAQNRKDELNEYLNNPQTRRSIEQVLITRKTMERLVEIAKNSDKNIKTTQKEEQK